MTTRQGDDMQCVRENARRCETELLLENERLRTRIAFFETSRGENERRLEAAEKRAELADALRALAGSLESEKVCVQQQLREAHDELDRYRKERADLEARLLSAEERNQRMERECGEAVAQSSNLANLYVASCRLHDTLDRAAVLAAIQEIIINLVGSEQIGIFELDGDQDMLSLIDSNGINPARFAGLRVKSGPIGRTACSGEIYVSDDAKEATPTACIPLKVDGRVVGVIAVFQLLSHKPALVPLDHEIFELLAAQAGAALYCTKLHLKERKASEQRCETERCE